METANTNSSCQGKKELVQDMLPPALYPIHSRYLPQKDADETYMKKQEKKQNEVEVKSTLPALLRPWKMQCQRKICYSQTSVLLWV